MGSVSNCKSSILVVEDSEDLRELEVIFLKDSGYNVFEAANGKEALEILRSMPTPCVVLLDLMMPVMNGHQFLIEAKNDTRLAQIPVLIVSAIADQSNLSTAVGFVRKPIDLDKLLNKLTDYCPQAS